MIVDSSPCRPPRRVAGPPRASGGLPRPAARWMLGLAIAAAAFGGVRHPAAAAVFVEPVVGGTTPSGIGWSAVASGTVLPLRTSGSLNGRPGAVAYWDTGTGRLQFDPRGWDVSLVTFTYTGGTTNVAAGTHGPLRYASGTVPVTAIVSGTSGLENQRTLPAGSYFFMECSQARISAAVSLSNTPTLASSYEPGNGAGNGTSPYATNPAGQACAPGWFNQPWAFPADLIDSGSVQSMGVGDWRVFGMSGTTNANALGYGTYQAVFQYTVRGVTGTQFGPVIPVPEASTFASSLAGLAIGCRHVLRRRGITAARAEEPGRAAPR